uniref:Remodeling and spacing factor 1-like n=1 Tax=Sinocyclocheilus grahami TaxID=75366 RepID=A0A672MJN4_SINGR
IMSASEAADGSSPELCPSFAVICSFLERYGALLDLPEVSFPELERSLQESSAVPKLLVDLHVKLLRKIGKSVSADRWEKNLIKICQEFNTTWAWELEKKGYREMTVECKTGILKYLCECQFDDNVKFKTAINEEDPDKMRLQPIGRDKDGLMYWFQLDQDHNVRVYVEEQDDLDGSSWKCIVRNRDSLAQILGLLKTQIDPALLVKKDQEEGSSSNCPNPENEEDKKKEGAEVEIRDEKSQNDLSASENKENILEKENAKQEDAETTDALLEKGLKVKEELQKHSETANGTNGSIKEEPQDEDEKVKDLSTPSQNTEQTEDVKRKSLEETQRALKNDHQAKIPLKKREMKLREDFDTSKSLTCFDDSRSNAEKINGHVPHLTTSESETQKGSESLQKESIEENNSEKLPLVLDESKERKKKRKDDQTEEKMDTNETRLCAEEQMEVEKSEESFAATAEENKEKSETSQSHEKILGEEKPSPVSEQSEKTPGSEDVTDHKKSPSSDAKLSTNGESKSIASKPSEETDGPQDKVQEQSESPKPTSSDLEKSSVSDSTNKPSTPKTTEKVDSEEKCDTAETDKNEDLETSKDKDEKGEAANSSEESAVKKSEEVKATERPNESNSLENPPSDREHEKEPDSKEGNKEKPMEVDKIQSTIEEGCETTTARKKETDVPVDQNTTSSKQSKQDATSEEREAPGDDQEKSTAAVKSSKRQGRPPKKALESQDEDKTGEEQEEKAQREGIRMKIKIPAHRWKAELQREEVRGDSESEVTDGRCLRRSPRICRPTTKAVEIQDRRVERKQATPVSEKEKDENEDKEDEDSVPRKPRKVGRRRKRQPWSRMRRKRKSSDDDEESEEEETEEDDSDEDYKVEKKTRKRRNRNRERNSSDSSSSSSEDDEPNDDPCKHCGLPNHPELILLCDSCDSGYHTACLRPPLMIIPDGEWFCSPCQHKQLCDRLEEQLQNLDAALKKKERAERRKERLVYVGISVENIITPSEEKEQVVKEKKDVKKSKGWGRRSTRAKKYISYRFDEFDEAIEDAIEEDIKEAEGGGAGRGKDMANITGHREKDMSTILQEDGKENGQPRRTSAAQKKKRRRLNDLDSDSTVDEEESEDEFRLSDSSEDEFAASDNDAESEAEVPSYEDSDFGSDVARPQRRQPPRRRRRPRGYSEEEEELETDEEEEMATEGSSEFSDSDLDVRCRRSYRSRKQEVNYCESSDSDGSQASTNKDKKKKRRRLSSSDSEVSFQSAESDEEDRKPKKIRADSSEEESRKRRRRLSLKRRRESEDDDDDDDSDESEEEERPIRKRVNRIDSDDSESEEEVKKSPSEKETEETVGKGPSPLDYNLVELPPTNGQSPVKGLEGLMPRPGVGVTAKNGNTPSAVSIAPNGMEIAAPDEDEDDLLGVTDLVDYVCNSEQL